MAEAYCRLEGRPGGDDLTFGQWSADFRAWSTSSTSSRHEAVNFSTPWSSNVWTTSPYSIPTSARLRSVLSHRRCPPRRTAGDGVAVVLDRSDRLERHGVHGVLLDQGVHVFRVGVIGVLGAGARPERPLHPRSRGCEGGPAITAGVCRESLRRPLERWPPPSGPATPALQGGPDPLQKGGRPRCRNGIRRTRRPM